MKIDFHVVRGKNFLQIGNHMETFPLDKSPFTVIVGRNGSGKTTLLDMITYVLFKRSHRPNMKLGQLINSTNKKGMLVEIAFSIGKTKYVVRRGEKPKVFEIYRDKKLIEPDPSIGDMQTYLEEQILKQNFKTFCQINVVGKVTYKQFLSLPAADRRVVVENILDSQIYSVMQALAKNDLKVINEELHDIETSRTVIQTNIETAQVMINKYNEDRTKYIDECLAEIESINENIAKYRGILEELTADYVRYKQEMQKIIPSDKLDMVREKMTELSRKLAVANNTKSKALQTIDKFDLESCPHCLQKVTEEHKAAIIAAAKKEVEEADVLIQDFTNKLNLARSKIDERERIGMDLSATENNIRMYQSNIKHLEGSIEPLNARIAKLKQPIELPEGLNIDDLKAKLAEKDIERDAVVIRITKLKEAIKLLGDDGIKAKLIDKYIPVINESINRYLERMNMFVEFNLDSEFNESINAINREGFTFDSFSEGQRQRIDLAILLTWRKIAMMRNSMTTNIFLLDEILDGSLDAEGVADFVDILKETADAQNVFIISHNESTIDLFERWIKVETDGNFSKYTFSD